MLHVHLLCANKNFLLTYLLTHLLDNTAVQSHQLCLPKADRRSNYIDRAYIRRRNFVQSTVRLVDFVYEFESGLITPYSSRDFTERVYLIVLSVLDLVVYTCRLLVRVHRKGFFIF